MGTKQNPGKYDCYEKAEPDEPMFILLARDPLAPILVSLWGMIMAREGEKSDKLKEAADCVRAMDKWRRANRGS